MTRKSAKADPTTAVMMTGRPDRIAGSIHSTTTDNVTTTPITARRPFHAPASTTQSTVTTQPESKWDTPVHIFKNIACFTVSIFLGHADSIALFHHDGIAHYPIVEDDELGGVLATANIDDHGWTLAFYVTACSGG